MIYKHLAAVILGGAGLVALGSAPPPDASVFKPPSVGRVPAGRVAFHFVGQFAAGELLGYTDIPTFKLTTLLKGIKVAVKGKKVLKALKKLEDLAKDYEKAKKLKGQVERTKKVKEITDKLNKKFKEFKELKEEHEKKNE